MPDENVDYICINGYFSSTEDAQRMFSEIRSHLDTDKKPYSDSERRHTVPMTAFTGQMRP